MPRLRPAGLLLFAALMLSGVMGLAALTPGAARDAGTPASPELARSIAHAQQRAADRRAALQHPAAARGRAASRARFRSLSDRDAIAVTRRTFGRHVAPGAARPLRGRRGIELVGSHAASVKASAGRRHMVAATEPIAGRDRAGRRVPLDLTLSRSEGSFRPAASATPLRVGATLGDGAVVGRGRVHVRPVGDAGSAGTVIGGSVVYANARRDTDVVLRPRATGVETYDVLRSADAPSSWRLRLGGDGIDVREAGGAIQLVRDGDVVGSVSRPWAIDADGTEVAVKSAVEGDALRLSVEHRGGDFRYPILVDPHVETFTWECDAASGGTTGQCDAGLGAWRFTGASDHFTGTFGTGSLGAGLYVGRPATVTRSYTGERAYWWYAPPIDTRTARVRLGRMSHRPGAADGTCMFTGTVKQTLEWHGAFGYDQGPITWCGSTTDVAVDYPARAATANSVAVFGVQTGANTAWPAAWETHLGFAEITLEDTAAPGLGQPTPAIPSGWTSTNQYSAVGTDTGLGVRTIVISGTAAYDQPCRASGSGFCPSSATATRTLPDGVTAVTGQAFDAGGLATTVRSWGTAKVDTTKPSITSITGSPWESSTPTIKLGAPMTVTATDPSPNGDTRERSGVKSIQLLVDGKSAEFASGAQSKTKPAETACPSDCDLTATLWFAGVDWPDGKHTVTVRVTDFAGNTFDKTFAATVDATPPIVQVTDRSTGPWAKDGDPVKVWANDHGAGVAKLGLDVGGARTGGQTFSCAAGTRDACVTREATLPFELTQTQTTGASLDVKAYAEDGTVTTRSQLAGLRHDVSDNQDFTGAGHVGTSSHIDQDYGSSSPLPGAIGDDTFSERWTGYITAPTSGTWTLISTSDDGVRVWIDDQLLIDDWTTHTATEKRGTVTMTGGQQRWLRVEHYDATGDSSIKLEWEGPGRTREVVPAGLLNQVLWGPRMQIYEGRDLGAGQNPDTAKRLERTPTVINHDWGAGTPDVTMPADNFSVRYTGRIIPRYSQDYTFTTTSDDGVRLWIDGRKLVDDWSERPLQSRSGTVKLEAGREYDVRMEYFEATGNAVAKLEWQSASQAREIIPNSQWRQSFRDSTPWKVKLDRSLPSIGTLSGPAAPGATTPRISRLSTLTASATDAGSGITSAKLEIGGQSVAAEKTQSCDAGGCGIADHRFDVDTLPVSEGEHTARLTITDAAGNRATKEWAIVVDRTAPRVTRTGALAAADGKWHGRVGEPSLTIDSGDPRGTAAEGPVTVTFAASADIPGRVESGCPQAPCRMVWTLPTIDPALVTDGKQAVVATTKDEAGNTALTRWNLNVDRGAPDLTASGTLVDALNGGQPLTGQSYAIRADATDGSATVPRSGAEKLQLLVDDKVVTTKTVACSAGSCALSADFTFVRSDHPNARRVAVKAVDAAGNARVRTWVVGTPSTTACQVGTTVTPTTSTDDVTVDEAYLAVRDALPAAVEPANNSDGEPLTLAESEGSLAATGTDPAVTVSEAAEDGFSVDTQQGTLCVRPTQTDASAGDATRVGNDSAVIYPNTGQSSDTVVRPTEKGVETFTTIRSGDASEEYRWTVDLAGDEHLQQSSEGRVVVVDPTPSDKPAEAALPEPVAAGTPQSDELAAEQHESTDTGDPNAAAEAEQAADAAGLEKPVEAEGETLAPEQHLGAPDDEVGTAPVDSSGQPLTENSPPPSDTALAAETAETETMAESQADADLATSRQEGSELVAETNAGNAAEAAEEPVVVATIEAPTSVDADGDPVPTTLTVEGDTVVMTVDHKDRAEVDYPVAADPWVQVPVTKYRIAYRPVYKPQTYVSHWAEGARYVGHWHIAWCWHGLRCTNEGWGWHRINHNGGRYLAYWPGFDWGPAYQLYWYPVYATRWVFSHWEPYWQAYTEHQWVNLHGANAFDTGGTEKIEHPNDGGTEPIATAAGRMRGCTRINHTGKIHFPGYIDVAHPKWTTRFCWNKWKKKASYSSASMGIEVNLTTAWSLKGYHGEVGDQFADNYDWNGGNFTRMWKNFKIRHCPLWVHVGCYDWMRLEWVTRGYWTGGHESVMRKLFEAP